jgi:hypothetical protein
MENTEKSKLNSDKIYMENMEGKVNWIVKRCGKCGRKVGWIVKWYGKYGRKVSWIVKRYGKYGRSPRLNSEKIWKLC